MLTQLPLLSLIIWLPIAAGLLCLFLNDRECLSKWLAVGTASLTILLSIALYIGFDNTSYQMQFEELHPWIATFAINYHLGIDGFSLPLIILTTISTLLVVMAGWRVIEYRLNHYLAAFLIMEGLMLAVFSALDAILFYVFFEDVWSDSVAEIYRTKHTRKAGGALDGGVDGLVEACFCAPECGGVFGAAESGVEELATEDFGWVFWIG